MAEFDEFDLEILREWQRDATLSAEQMASRVALSRNACWRRMRRLEDEGYLRGRVALVDAEKAGLGLTVVILIRTTQHDAAWLEKFRGAVAAMPQITAAWRMSGDLDYALLARVADVKSYDTLYQQLINRVPLADVSASFVMEEIKNTTALPLTLAEMRAAAARSRFP